MLPLQGEWIQFLVGELRSHRAHGTAEKGKRNLCPPKLAELDLVFLASSLDLKYFLVHNSGFAILTKQLLLITITLNNCLVHEVCSQLLGSDLRDFYFCVYHTNMANILVRD